MIAGLKFAIGYFAIFNVNFQEDFNQKTANWTMFFVPFIGFLLAIFSALIYHFLSQHLALLYSGFIAGFIYLASYGFLHLEGLIDTVDGYYGKLSGKDPYKIMKEPHVGAMGIVWACGFIFAKLVTIGYLLSENGVWIFIAVLILSRLSVGYVLTLFEILEGSKLALMLQVGSKTFLGTISTVLALALVVFLAGLNGIILGVLGFFISLIFAYKIKKEIGFINGDVLGANIELTELSLLFIGLFLIN